MYLWRDWVSNIIAAEEISTKTLHFLPYIHTYTSHTHTYISKDEKKYSLAQVPQVGNVVNMEFFLD